MWSNQENRVRKQVKNPCEARKIKASQILHKIISTHILTVLIVNVIVQIEQRKRGKKKELLRNPESWMFQITTHQIFQTNISYVLNNIYKVLEGDMTYDDA